MATGAQSLVERRIRAGQEPSVSGRSAKKNRSAASDICYTAGLYKPTFRLWHPASKAVFEIPEGLSAFFPSRSTAIVGVQEAAIALGVVDFIAQCVGVEAVAKAVAEFPRFPRFGNACECAVVHVSCRRADLTLFLSFLTFGLLSHLSLAPAHSSLYSLLGASTSC